MRGSRPLGEPQRSAGWRIVQDLPGTTVPQRLTVQETGVFTSVSVRPPLESRGDPDIVLSAAPNPARGAMWFTLRGGAVAARIANPIHIGIWDTAGRLVRSLAVQGGDGGENAGTAEWDGRDASGEEVPAGIYFARAGGGSSATTRLVLMR